MCVCCVFSEFSSMVQRVSTECFFVLSVTDLRRSWKFILSVFFVSFQLVISATIQESPTECLSLNLIRRKDNPQSLK